MVQLIIACLGLILIFWVIYWIGLLLYHAAPYLLSAAAIYGAGIALRNYGLAFANNVKPRRPGP